MTPSDPTDGINALDVIANLPEDDYERAAILQKAATSGAMRKWRFPAYVDEAYPAPKEGELPSLGKWDSPPSENN